MISTPQAAIRLIIVTNSGFTTIREVGYTMGSNVVLEEEMSYGKR